MFSICTHTLSTTFYSCQVRMCPVCGHFLDIPLTFAPCHVVEGDYIIDVGMMVIVETCDLRLEEKVKCLKD